MRGRQFNIKPGGDYSGANMYAADLTRMDLSGVNFGGADLSKANFSDANLARANFSGANLTGATLKEANFTDVKIDETTIFPDGTTGHSEVDWAKFTERN